jgi:hypothetical protein
VKLILRSGGRIENRDPFRRNPSGLTTQTAAIPPILRFRAKEMITLGAVARSIHRATQKTKTTEVG